MSLFFASAVAAAARSHQAELSARNASAAASAAHTKADLMEMDVEKLFMITEALWLLLKEQHGYSDEDLIRRVQEIDLQDGKLDGKVAKQQKPACSQCGRTLIGSRPVCLYCGAAVERGPFER